MGGSDDESKDVVEDSDGDAGSKKSNPQSQSGVPAPSRAEVADNGVSDADEDEVTSHEPARKRARNDYVLDEAEVETEGEDEDEDEEDLAALEAAEEREGAGFEVDEDYEPVPMDRELALHRPREERAEIEARKRYTEELAERARLEARPGWGARDVEDADMVATTDDIGILQRSMLPTFRDPKLWVVRCKPGQERLLSVALMSKFLAQRESGYAPPIISALAPAAKVGYIYLEAEKSEYVTDFLKGMRGVFARTIAMVPLDEMAQVLTRPKELPKVSVARVQQWVRVKRGLYKGDIGMITDMDDEKDTATVRIIPRLDLKRIEQKAQQVPGDKMDEDRKRSKARARTLRPPKSLFNRDVIRGLGGDVKEARGVGGLAGERFELFERELFKDGYVYKKIATKNLVVGIEPAFDELQEYEGKQQTDASAEIVHAVEMGNTHPLTFRPGERVRVVNGELKNLVARVLQMDGDLVMVRAEEAALAAEPLPFLPSQLAKHVVMGTHVQITEGRDSGETGVVVAVSDGGVVDIYTDLTSQHISAYVAHVQETEAVSSGVHSIANYGLFDMVQLNVAGEMLVAVITKVEKRGFRALTNKGETRSLRLEDIARKRSSRVARSLDISQNPLVVGDSVRLVEGPHKGRRGTIKHLFKFCAFVHCRELLENSGMIAASTRHVQLAGGAERKQAAAVDPFAMVAQHKGALGVAWAAARRQRDPLINRTVTVRRGPWRGYAGVVTDATDDAVNLALNVKRKRITVDKNNIALVETDDLPGMGSAGDGGGVDWSAGATPLHAPMTPGWGDGGRTPMHEAAGQTPLHESAGTPGWRADTPGADLDGFGAAFGGATPFDVEAAAGRLGSGAGGSEAEAEFGRRLSAADGGGERGAVVAGALDHPTPAMPTPAMPSGIPTTPGGAGMIPATPGPATPAPPATPRGELPPLTPRMPGEGREAQRTAEAAAADAARERAAAAAAAAAAVEEEEEGEKAQWFAQQAVQLVAPVGVQTAGTEAVIASVQADGRLEVRFADGCMAECSRAAVRAVRPGPASRVLVLVGRQAGSAGRWLMEDGKTKDVAVLLDDAVDESDISIVPITQLGVRAPDGDDGAS